MPQIRHKEDNIEIILDSVESAKRSFILLRVLPRLYGEFI